MIRNNICYRVTRKCNWCCHFCQAPRNSLELSTDQHFVILEKLFENGFRSIKITGGEPLVRTDLESIIERAYNIGYKVTLCSNGSILRESVLTLLAKGEGKIKISLHSIKGTKIMKKSFCYKAMEGISSSVKKGIHTSIHCLVTMENWHELDDIVSYAERNNVKKVTFIPIVKRGYLKHKTLRTFIDWQTVEEYVQVKTKEYHQIKIKFLDLYKKRYYVLETDGSLYLQSEDENNDILLMQILAR